MSCETEDNLFPQRYEIDYVRVYQLTDDPLCTPGDVNDDGAVDVLDVVSIVESILDTTAGSNSCADINDDGTVDVLDIVVIVNEILNP